MIAPNVSPFAESVCPMTERSPEVANLCAKSSSRPAVSKGSWSPPDGLGARRTESNVLESKVSGGRPCSPATLTTTNSPESGSSNNPHALAAGNRSASRDVAVAMIDSTSRSLATQIPEGCLVAIIRRQGETLVPHGSTVVEAGDWLTIIGATDDIRHLREMYGMGQASGTSREGPEPVFPSS